MMKTSKTSFTKFDEKSTPRERNSSAFDIVWMIYSLKRVN